MRGARRAAVFVVAGSALAAPGAAHAAKFIASCKAPPRVIAPYFGRTVGITLFAPGQYQSRYFGPNTRCQQARGIARRWASDVRAGGYANSMLVVARDGKTWRCTTHSVAYETTRTDCWRKWTLGGRLLKYHASFISGV